MDPKVPVIDISPFIDGTDPEKVVRQIDDACRDIGFLVIKGHGVSSEVIGKVLNQAQEFFNRPDTDKSSFHVEPGHGYQKFANMSLSQSYEDKEFPPDLREALSLRRNDFESNSAVFRDHSDIDRMQTELGEYYAEISRVADVLLAIFEKALGTTPGYLRERSKNHDSNLSLYHYPAMSQPPLPGQIRGGEHTDFGSITILLGHPSVHGLQIKSDMGWEDAPVEPGTFVVNIGDLMERWTNDVWKSTIHRVANPVDGDWDTERYSIVFFHQPDYDALIESLDAERPAKYPPITSGDHFFRKSGAMFDGK